MANFVNPRDLNPLKQFLQAGKILKSTSRAKNPAWYQQALDLDFQLHIRTDGAGVRAFLHDQREDLWAAAPALGEKHLLDPAAMKTYVAAALGHARSAGGKALGVILHVADEFSLTEIKSEFSNRDSLGKLREQAEENPASILADSIQEDQLSWRIVPYFAPKSHTIATAATISRRYDETLAALRELGETEDFPVITCALSSPLVALLGIHGRVKPTPGRPATVILQYPFFTVLAFFDENSDLLLLRTQLHRGLLRPPNFRHAIATTLATLEIDSPDIFIYGLGQDVDHSLAADLSGVFPTSHIEQIIPQCPENLPAWCSEVLISTRKADPSENPPGITFRTFREDRWALQNFLPTARAAAEIYPTKQEITLLRALGFARRAAACIGIAAVVWLICGMFEISRTPEWKFDPALGASTKQRLIALGVEKQRVDHWNGMLEDRTRGWSSMEALARLFPESSGLLVRTFQYNSQPNVAPGQAKVGFMKEWKINGVVNSEGIEILNALNTREGIAARFREIAEITGDSSFHTDSATRNLLISIRTQENAAYKAAGPPPSAVVAGAAPGTDSNHPFVFEVEITQRFEATDPLAVTSAKAP